MCKHGQDIQTEHQGAEKGDVRDTIIVCLSGPDGLVSLFLSLTVLLFFLLLLLCYVSIIFYMGTTKFTSYLLKKPLKCHLVSIFHQANPVRSIVLY